MKQIIYRNCVVDTTKQAGRLSTETNPDVWEYCTLPVLWGGNTPLTNPRYVQNTSSHGGVSDSPTPDPVQRRLASLSIVVSFNLPQLHSYMAELYTEAEAYITKAMGSISNNKNVSISELAKDLNVPAQ